MKVLLVGGEPVGESFADFVRDEFSVLGELFVGEPHCFLRAAMPSWCTLISIVRAGSRVLAGRRVLGRCDRL